MQINFENSRLAYVTACSSFLTCTESLDLKELDRIIHHVYESYSEYNRKNAGRGALTDSQPPFRRFLLKEGFSWNSQLSMYTNYGRFIDVFQRFVSSTVETSGLSEMQEKELFLIE